MLRFIDGFDWGDNIAYEAVVEPPLKYYPSFITFSQLSMVPGRFGGQAINPFNTAFGEANWTQVFIGSAQSQWSTGFAFQLSGVSGVSPLFFRMESGSPSNTVVALVLDSATSALQVYRNGTGTNSGKGTLVATTSLILPTIGWTYIEVFVIVAGAGSTLEIWADDAPILRCGPTGPDGPIDLGTNLIDRTTFRWESFGTQGYLFDDYYVADAQGTLNNGRLGPSRVMAVPVSGDATLSGGWIRNSGSTDFGCVDEFATGPNGAPDYDVTYLGGTASCSDLFNVPSMACVGSILGVALNAVLKGAPPAAVALEVQPTAMLPVTTLASLSPPGNGTDWANLQAITETDLATGAPNWTDGDITRAIWGAGLSSGSAHCTQCYVEKLVSLRSVPFSCGGLNSYAL